MTRPYGLGRTERLSLALTPDEVETIRYYAREHGLPVSEYIRWKATENPIEKETS